MDSRGSEPTPEKQLLKLIEQPQDADAGAEMQRPAGAGALSPSAIRGRFSFLKRGTSRGGGDSRKGIGLKGFNKLLAAAAVMLVLFLGWDVTTSLKELKAMDPLEPTPIFSIDVDRPLRAPVTGEDYHKEFSRRNPFDFYREKVEVVDETPKVTVEELKKRELAALKDGLVYVGYRKRGGVLVGRIRDTRSDTRHLVKAGDDIGGLRIVSVLRDKVVVSFGGMADELPLGGQE